MVSEDDLGGCLGGMEGSQGASGVSLGFLGVSGVASESLDIPGESQEVFLDFLRSAWGPWEVPGRSFVVPRRSLGALWGSPTHFVMYTEVNGGCF